MTIKQINVSSVELLNDTEQSSNLETECLFGEKVSLLKKKGSWSYCKNLNDNYQGWIYGKVFGEPLDNNYRVISIRTFVYPCKNIKSKPILHLSMGSFVRVLSKNLEWAEILLNSGELNSVGYVLLKDICKLNEKVADWVAVAEKLLYVPYKWGGKNTLGIDCSALVQLSLQSINFYVPRNTYDQININLPQKTKHEPFRRGMIVFWERHVGIMVDNCNLIHANAHSMRVSIESLKQVQNRIKTKMKTKVLICDI